MSTIKKRFLMCIGIVALIFGLLLLNGLRFKWDKEWGYFEITYPRIYADGISRTYYLEPINVDEIYDFSEAMTLATSALNEYMNKGGHETYSIVSYDERCAFGHVPEKQADKVKNRELEGVIWVIFKALSSNKEINYGVVLYDDKGTIEILAEGTDVTFDTKIIS